MTALLENGLGSAATANGGAQFEQVDGRTVCRVTVQPSSSPVWTRLKAQEDALYVRQATPPDRWTTRRLRIHQPPLPLSGSGQRMERFEQTISVCQDAAAIFREIGDRHGEGGALRTNRQSLFQARAPLSASVVCREDLVQLIQQVAQRMARNLPPVHPGFGHGASQQDDHLGILGTEPLQPRHLVRLIRHQGQRGPCRTGHSVPPRAQSARILAYSSSGVSPVSSSPSPSTLHARYLSLLTLTSHASPHARRSASTARSLPTSNTPRCRPAAFP